MTPGASPESPYGNGHFTTGSSGMMDPMPRSFVTSDQTRSDGRSEGCSFIVAPRMGITSWKGALIQLTWKENKGFVYEKESFRLLREFSYPTEGWGITHDDIHLIMSDGSASLYFLDPATFVLVRKMEVHDRGTPVSGLNELEYLKGRIYANIWSTERIAIISPETGRVEGWIDLTGLSGSMGHSQKIDVLNGIAYDRDNDRLFVTGKLWPRLFEIKLIPVKP